MPAVFMLKSGKLFYSIEIGNNTPSNEHLILSDLTYLFSIETPTGTDLVIDQGIHYDIGSGTLYVAFSSNISPYHNNVIRSYASISDHGSAPLSPDSQLSIVQSNHTYFEIEGIDLCPESVYTKKFWFNTFEHGYSSSGIYRERQDIGQSVIE